MAQAEVTQDSNKSPTLPKVPPFPPIATRLLQTLSQENTPVQEVVALIRADPALSSGLLQRANSPLYGFVSQISSLQQALVLLGLSRVRNLAVTVAAGKYASVAREVPELHRCWRYTLVCALLAEELGRVSPIEPDRAYTAGLLHDIGRLALLVAHPKEYADLVRTAEDEGRREDSSFLLDREREVFGLDHCQAGHYLAQEWGWPLDLIAAASRHHDRPYGSQFDLLKIIYLSWRLADTLGYEVVPSDQPWDFQQIRSQLPDSAQQRFWTDASELKEFVEAKLNALDPLPPLEADATASECTETEESQAASASRTGDEHDLGHLRRLDDTYRRRGQPRKPARPGEESPWTGFREVFVVFALGLILASLLILGLLHLGPS